MQMMSRRCCILCGYSRPMYLLRYASKRRQQTAILMQAYMECNSPPLQKIKDAFKECLEKNKRLCHVHYAEAAQRIATKLADLGVQFSHYMDPTASGSTAYLNEGDIPPLLVERLDSAVKIIDEKLVITARDIGRFMNRCLQQYFSEYEYGKKLEPSSLADLRPEELPFYKEEPVISEVEQPFDMHDREIDITALLSAPDPGFMDSTANENEESTSYQDETSTYDIGNELSTQQVLKECVLFSEEDRTVASMKVEPNAEKQQEDPAELEQTNPTFMKQLFMVEGQALLELFRFCPLCGCGLREKGGVQLTANGSTPLVHYICSFCSQQSSSRKLWEGRKNNERTLKLEKES